MQNTNDATPDRLTPRQAEFLAMSARGKTRKEIAESLSLSPWTVDNIFKSARSRLASKTNAQAVARAIATEQLILDHVGNVYVPSALS